VEKPNGMYAGHHPTIPVASAMAPSAPSATAAAPDASVQPATAIGVEITGPQ
jgi:hypothetical protein